MRFGNFVVVKHNGKIVCGKVGDQGIYLKQMGDANPIPFREVEPLFEIEVHRPFPEHFKVDDFRKFVISTLADADPVKRPHPAITHCDNCGCDWLDNGLNPVGCPYCKLSAETEALEQWRQAVRAMEALAHYSVDLTTYHYGYPSNPEDGPEQCDCVRCRTIAALRERLSKGA